MARGYSNVAFKWNGSSSVTIGNLGFGAGLNKEAAEIFYDHYYKYIPYLRGDLSDNVRISSTEDHGTIAHLVRYARKQYYADEGTSSGKDVSVHRTRFPHVLATSHWDYWCWTVEKRDITREVDEARLKYRKYSV